MSVIYKSSIDMVGWTILYLCFGFIHKNPFYIAVTSGLHIILKFYFIKSLLLSNFVFSQRHDNVRVEPHPLLYKTLIIHNSFLKSFVKIHDSLVVKPLPLVVLDQDPLLRICNNNKPDSLAWFEDAEGVECVFKMPVLTPDIISICFIQPATADLTTALSGFVKLSNNWKAWFSSLYTDVACIQQSKAATTYNALSDGNA